MKHASKTLLIKPIEIYWGCWAAISIPAKQYLNLLSYEVFDCDLAKNSWCVEHKYWSMQQANAVCKFIFQRARGGGGLIKKWNHYLQCELKTMTENMESHKSRTFSQIHSSNTGIQWHTKHASKTLLITRTTCGLTGLYRVSHRASRIS